MNSGNWDDITRNLDNAETDLDDITKHSIDELLDNVDAHGLAYASAIRMLPPLDGGDSIERLDLEAAIEEMRDTMAEVRNSIIVVQDTVDRARGWIGDVGFQLGELPTWTVDDDLVDEALKIAAAVARGEDTEYLLRRMPARDIEKLKTIRS